jgi:AbrB family looped-hinge helix DNA binding protein
MIAKTVKISDKGQISIPTMIRESANLKKGDEILIIEKEGRIIIESLKNITKEYEDDFKDIELATQSSLSEVWENDEDEIWNKYTIKDAIQ